MGLVAWRTNNVVIGLDFLFSPTLDLQGGRERGRLRLCSVING